MITAPELAGPHRPEPATPDRRPGSVRRTTTIDTTRPDGLDGDQRVDARGRDLATDPDGTPHVLTEHRLALTIDAGRTILALNAEPAVDGVEALVGTSIATAFRRTIAPAVPDEVKRRTLAHLLLDDLVGATLVAGYALQRAGRVGIKRSDEYADAAVAAMADVCAGWATDASILVTFRERGEVPAPLGPVAPVLERADDPWSWHEAEPLPPHGVRRRRRTDAWWDDAGECFGVDAHFRDSYVDPDALETVVHEYSVRGRVGSDRTVLAMEADDRVLPWRECPQAVPSAAGVVGARVEDLPDLVRRDLRGVGTCTHLNDVVRGLGDLGPLLHHVASP